MRSSLLIAGASARAAALSASRNGENTKILTCDLFADRDLRAIAEASRIRSSRFPEGLTDWAQQKVPAAWMFTGGVENYAHVIHSISSRHRLLGCPAESVARVRNPFELSRVLSAHGYSVPEMRVSSEPDAPGIWLVKPFRSCGGLGIRVRSRDVGTASDGAGESGTHYLQRFVTGQSLAGLYLCDQRSCRLLGVTRSWSRADLESDVGGGLSDFRYLGSVGGLALDELQQRRWASLGQIIAAQFRLEGLFGVDTIVTPAGDICVLEVNPRYTASMETLERPGRLSLVQQHIEACVHAISLPESVAADCPVLLGGKAIVYAPDDMVFSANVSRKFAEIPKLPAARLADLPAIDSPFKSGQPVCSILAYGPDVDSVTDRLGLPSKHHAGRRRPGLLQKMAACCKTYGITS